MLLDLAAEPRRARRPVVAAAHEQAGATAASAATEAITGGASRTAGVWHGPTSDRPAAPAAARPSSTVTPSRYRHPHVVGPVAPPRSASRSREGTVLASIPSASLLGATGIPVRVEVHIGKGLPGFRIVGQPDPTCRESRDRVRAAVMSAGHEWPTKCITVNLAPSGPRKIGAGLDLAIAVGVHHRQRAAAARHASTGSGSSASSGSTARCGGSRAWRRWWPCSATSTPSCRRRRPPRPSWRRNAAVRVASTLAEVLGALAGLRTVARRPGRRADASTRRRSPISPTCAGSRSPGGRSRSPPPAATTC